MSSAPIDSELLSVLACPKCRGDLTLAEDEKGLICETCRIVYPLRDGVPVMLIEEAFPLQARQQQPESLPEVPNEKSVFPAVFLIVEGKNKGERIEVEKGTCRAVGRSLDEAERTKIFSVDSVIGLDDASKKMVIQYVSKQFRNRGSGTRKTDTEDLGGFVRGTDFQIRDLAVSRLHAMIFHDDTGVVGILDLVSKNGTFVNGAEVESKILKKDDLITIGNTKIRFES